MSEATATSWGRWMLALHESAHIVAGYALTGRPGYAVVNETRGAAWPHVEDAYPTAEAVICIAGRVGENLALAHGPPTDRPEPPPRSDAATAEATGRVLHGIVEAGGTEDDADTIAAYTAQATDRPGRYRRLRYLKLRAARVLDERLVLDLATLLYSRGYCTPRDVVAAATRNRSPRPLADVASNLHPLPKGCTDDRHDRTRRP
mgnify:CR=1 FL=1